MSKEYTTKSGKQYTTTPSFTGVVLSDVTVNGSVINPSWKKDMRMITMNINNKLITFVSEETVEVSIGTQITTHASVNSDGVRFISLRHI